MPWRFNFNSSIDMDENDYTVIDMWKVARKIKDGFFSLKLPQPVFDGKHMECLGDYWGTFYGLNQESFARWESIGLFCFLDRELAVNFGHKIRDKKMWNVPDCPLWILQGKGILPELYMPKKLVKIMREPVIIQYYKRFYFNMDTHRWTRAVPLTPDQERWEKLYLRKLAPHLMDTHLFAGFKTIGCEPLPLKFEDDPEVKKYMAELDKEKATDFDMDDPQWDFLDE